MEEEQNMQPLGRVCASGGAGWRLLGVVSVGPAPPSRAAEAVTDLRVSEHPYFLLWPQRQLRPGLQVPEKPLHT